MGAVAPDAREVMAVALELVGGEQLISVLIVYCGPLELEEQEQRLDLGGALLHELEQRSAGRVGGVGGELEARVRAGAPD